MALGLLAYEIAGGDAGAVLGTALAIKMIAYVGVAPITGAFANKVPRRALLVAMDAIRAAVALCLPFVTQVWEVYILIFVLQSASLPPRCWWCRRPCRTRSRSRTRAASTAKTTLGTRIYLKTPRLRGLLALTLAAAASAMAIVNTVVIVKGLGLSQRDVALTLAALGGGSITAALTLPRILDRIADRTVMIAAATLMTVALAAMVLVTVTMAKADGYWYALIAG